MINFYAPINYLGYGIHSYNLIKAYSKQFVDEPVSILPPFGNVQWKDTDVEKWLDNRKNIQSSDLGVMIFNEPFLSQFSGRKRIGFPVFEMERFDEISKSMMRTCDHLLTPSKWGKGVLESELGQSNIDVVPEGYDPELFYPDYSQDFKMQRIEERGLTFIHVGKWEKRKGTVDVLTAFIKAFEGARKKATLYAWIGNNFNPNWNKEVRQFLEPHVEANNRGELVYERGSARIVIPHFPKHLSFREMAHMYREADFGIWLSKAEGWNLPLMECIACGTPAITTDWTGMSEYLQDYPEELKVPSCREEIANDNFWFRGDRGSWKIPDTDKATSMLEAIRDDHEKYLWMEKKCTESISEFTWDNAAKKLHEVLQRVGG